MAQVSCGKMSGNGVFQEDIYNMIYNIKTSISTMTALLDADATLTDIDYNTLDIVLPINGFSKEGMSQTDIYKSLVDITTSFNLILAKLDADDASVTDYAAVCGVTNRMNPTGYVSHAIYQDGMNQEDIIWYLDLIRTNIALCTAKLDASGGVATTTYADNCNVTDVIE